MSRIEKTTLTNMCMIYYSSGNVLVQDRRNPDWPGITFPGGHVEPGESFTDSVIREVLEETGLSISHLQMCGIKDWINDDGIRYMVLLYKTNTFSGEIKSSDEGEIYWTRLNELNNMNLAGGMDKMLRIFLEDGLSEQFFYKENGKWLDVLK